MKKHVHYSFTRPGKNDGFWFLCLKTAYGFNIKGILKCRENDVVEIDAEGEETNLNVFFDWLKSHEDIRSIHTIYESFSEFSNYKEFDIFIEPNQIYN